MNPKDGGKMPYIKDSEIKIGTLVLVQDALSLKPQVCMIVQTSFKDAYKGFVTILYPDGKKEQINRHYIRRMPDENR